MLEIKVHFNPTKDNLFRVAAAYGLDGLQGALLSEAIDRPAEACAEKLFGAPEELSHQIQKMLITPEESSLAAEQAEVVAFVVAANEILDALAAISYRLEIISHTRPDLAADLLHALYDNLHAQPYSSQIVESSSSSILLLGLCPSNARVNVSAEQDGQIR